MASTLRIILGNQLFPLDRLPAPDDVIVFMAEDMSLCTDVRHHAQKLVLFLAAMRNYADALVEAGYDVRYHRLDPDDPRDYEEKLTAVVDADGLDRVSHFEVEDAPMAMRLEEWARLSALERTIETSPMFLCDRARFGRWLDSAGKPRMADFYRAERQRLGILVDRDGEPDGGRWSFDTENRRKLPADVDPPPVPARPDEPHVGDVVELVGRHFKHHPGRPEDFWLPVRRDSALAWLDAFLTERLDRFGPYEDAISTRSRTVFHGVLSPLLNLGLVTPDEVIARAIREASRRDVPLASLEGFIRQIIGWREFVRGIYHHHGDAERAENFWQHSRALGPAWYEGDTGIAPLDEAIRNARDHAWDHHIVRLMVVGNLMTLCEIEPQAAYRWFMEMYADSSDWVMTANVFGMGTFSDGGLFATKPYLCGSNYLLKMSDYPRGDWCDVVDGLYWRFISRHRDYFSGNPRLSMMPRMLDRLAKDRLERIVALADAFIERHTRGS